MKLNEMISYASKIRGNSSRKETSCKMLTSKEYVELRKNKKKSDKKDIAK